MFKDGFEFSQRADPFAARELVDLRCHDRQMADRRMQPLPCRAVAVETRMPRVHQQERADSGWKGWMGGIGGRVLPFLPVQPFPPLLAEKRPRQLVEHQGRVFPTPRVAVPGEIHQIQRRTMSARDAIDVRQPRLARRRARTREAPTNERVDQARLADVGPSDQRDFRQVVQWEVASGGGAYDEISVNLQWVIVSSTIASTGSACASAGRRPASGSTSAIFRTSSIVWTM
jgi:hypothetical protein